MYGRGPLGARRFAKRARRDVIDPFHQSLQAYAELHVLYEASLTTSVLQAKIIHTLFFVATCPVKIMIQLQPIEWNLSMVVTPQVGWNRNLSIVVIPQSWLK